MDKKQAQELAQHMKQAMAGRDIGGLQRQGQTREQYIAENKTWGRVACEVIELSIMVCLWTVAAPFILAWEVLKHVNFGVVFVIPIGGRDD